MGCNPGPVLRRAFTQDLILPPPLGVGFSSVCAAVARGRSATAT